MTDRRQALERRDYKPQGMGGTGYPRDDSTRRTDERRQDDNDFFYTDCPPCKDCDFTGRLYHMTIPDNRRKESA